MPMLGMYDLNVPNPDPEYHYCWLPVSDKYLFMQYSQLGYTPVQGDSLNKVFGKEMAKHIVDENGYARYRELVLCQIPMQTYAAYQYESLKYHADRRQLGKEKFMELVDSLGPHVKAFATSKEQYEDEKEFATREGANRVSYSGIDVKAVMEQAAKVAAEAAKKAIEEAAAVATTDAPATKSANK